MRSDFTPSAIYGEPVPGVQVNWLQEFLQRASQPPTVEEYKLSVKFAIESLPQSVRDLSFESVGFELTVEERDYLSAIAGECSPGSGMTEELAWEKIHEFSRHPMFHQLADKCQAIIEQFDEPPLFKFGTRSPKDSPYFERFAGRVPSGGAVLANIATSWRAFEDMAIAQVNASDDKRGVANHMASILGLGKRAQKEDVNHLPWMWFREYIPIEKHQEFRCFMKDRRFVGASQYHGVVKNRRGEYQSVVAFPDLVKRGYEYEAAIKQFFHEKFLPATDGYCQGCVFDVAVDLDAGSVTLIEINPALPSTFPGFMDWNDPASFDGELKWADASYLPDSGVIHIQESELRAQIENDHARRADAG